MTPGISAKEFKLIRRVQHDDPEMSARAWNRVASRELYTPENIIGYATFMGPGNVTHINSALGWMVLFNKFESIPMYVREDIDQIKNRADFQITPTPLDARRLRRIEELEAKELYDLKAIAKEYSIGKRDKQGNVTGLTRKQIINLIIDHEMEANS